MYLLGRKASRSSSLLAVPKITPSIAVQRQGQSQGRGGGEAGEDDGDVTVTSEAAGAGRELAGLRRGASRARMRRCSSL